MKITGQAVSVTELIKGTSERFGNGGLSRFISGVQNSSEQQFCCTKEQAELLGTKNFAALKDVFGHIVAGLDMTPFKNISDEIKGYREKQSIFSRFCKGRVLDKIQERCTKIIAINEDLNRSPVLLRDATLPDSAVYTTKDIMGKHKAEGFFVLQKSLTAGKDGSPVNRADPDKLTQVTIQTSGTVELPAPQPVV
ncbi:hypothetical protein JC794_02260 [Morganella morganii]|uniref:hypothetical protein n=1 Tax=Morganella morganii TaxID=582 RepID=UPI000D1E54C9|nr:hypothetical protein [Morganella morganii]HAE79808.1 hypothetical protein [Morganella sp. (in: enterobacteria)]QXO43167.1 hypothetical protein CXB74_002345 [Morganella morganii]QXO46748.1 hypothetical protein JC862_02250 [Morganella morganii]QXO50509.1 hypothetical protein JC861_02355 [Morganella morganii]QXO54360.1 hypothetical protein JC830_02255 [Morganella morganii]